MSDPSEAQCLICEGPVYDYDPMMCCSGFECGCMGNPTNPCICSSECWDALMPNGFVAAGTMEERRVCAGIPLFTPAQQEPSE